MKSNWDFEKLYSLLFKQAKVGVVLRDIESGHVHGINQTYLDMIGRSKEEMQFLTFKEISHPQEQLIHDELESRMILGEIREYSVAKRYIKKSGETIWALVTCSCIEEKDEKPKQIIAIAQDITEFKMIDELLSYVATLDRKSMQTSYFDAVCDYLQTSLNLAAVLIVKGPSEHFEVLGSKFKRSFNNPKSVHIKDFQRSNSEFEYLAFKDTPNLKIDNESVQDFLEFNRVLIKLISFRQGIDQAGIIFFRDSASSVEKVIEPIMRVIAPVIEREIVEIDDASKIWKQANFDSLTELPNRASFFENLNSLLKNSKNNNKFALLFIDVDDFKSINDSYGHHFGDQVLVQIGRRLNQSLRSSDYVYRVGGDEFTVIAPNLKNDDFAVSIAEKIIDSFIDPFMISGKKLHVKCSVGITVFPDDVSNPDEFLINADQAMYAAKQLGKNRYVYFSQQINQASRRKSIIQQDIRDVLTNNQLYLVYQPIIDLSTGKIKISELLLRWEHPVLGNISPLEFIPIAEQLGEINEITKWVVDQLCLVLTSIDLRLIDGVKFAINISPVLFKGDYHDFFDYLVQKFARNNLNGSSLILEITESVLIEDELALNDVIEKMHNLNIGIALDDFGVGYSSVSYLKSFDFDVVKLDKSIVTSVMQNDKDKIVFNSIVDLSHKLGFQVVAEGIETEDVLNAVVLSKTELGQGYLFSRPLKVDDFRNLLSKNNLIS